MRERMGEYYQNLKIWQLDRLVRGARNAFQPRKIAERGGLSFACPCQLHDFIGGHLDRSRASKRSELPGRAFWADFFEQENSIPFLHEFDFTVRRKTQLLTDMLRYGYLPLGCNTRE